MTQHQIKLRKFSCRHQSTERLGGRVVWSSAAWIPYGHPLLENSDHIQSAEHIGQAVRDNNHHPRGYSGIFLHKERRGGAHQGRWIWNIIQPADPMLPPGISQSLPPNTRRIVLAGLLDQSFDSREHARQALAGLLEILGGSE